MFDQTAVTLFLPSYPLSSVVHRVHRTDEPRFMDDLLAKSGLSFLEIPEPSMTPSAAFIEDARKTGKLLGQAMSLFCQRSRNTTRGQPVPTFSSLRRCSALSITSIWAQFSMYDTQSPTRRVVESPFHWGDEAVCRVFDLAPCLLPW